jgi:hypothetical protein
VFDACSTSRNAEFSRFVADAPEPYGVRPLSAASGRETRLESLLSSFSSWDLSCHLSMLIAVGTRMMASATLVFDSNGASRSSEPYFTKYAPATEMAASLAMKIRSCRASPPPYAQPPLDDTP